MRMPHRQFQYCSHFDTLFQDANGIIMMAKEMMRIKLKTSSVLKLS